MPQAVAFTLRHREYQDPPKHTTSQLHGSLYSYVFKHLCILFEAGSDQTGQTGLELKTFLL